MDVSALEDRSHPIDDNRAYLLPGILNIPSDVIFTIMVELVPMDIVCLFSTSTALYALFKERITWIILLRALCHQRSIFLPSYPIADMCVDRLRRACMGPHLFAQLLESHSGFSSELPPIDPLQRRPLMLGEPVQYEAAFLVPGGRFLVLAHRHSLELWDLGPSDTASLNDPIRLAQTSIECNPIPGKQKTCLTVRMFDQETLRIALAIGSTKLIVYDIKPGNEGCEFLVVSCMTLDPTTYTNNRNHMSCGSIILMDDFLVFQIGDGERSIVWNFRQGWYALGPNRQCRSLHMTILRPDIVVEYTEFTNGLIQWSASFQNLHTYPVHQGKAIDFSEAMSDEKEIHDISHFQLSAELFTDRWPVPTLVFPLSTWSSEGDEHVTFDIVETRPFRGPVARLRAPVQAYRFNLIVSPVGDGRHQVECALRTTFSLPPLRYRYIPEQHPPGRLGRGFGTGSGLQLVRYGSDGDPARNAERLPWGLSMYSLPRGVKGKQGLCWNTEHQNMAPVEARLARLLNHDVFDGARPSVCMASGRMYHHMTSTTTCISEFLPPWRSADASFTLIPYR